MDGVLGEGNPDGVADAVGEQGADADGALDAAVLAVAGLGDAEVDRVVPVRTLGGEAGDEQAVSLDHDLGIGRLHRKHQLVVALLAGDAGELERALDHAERGVAVAVHDPVRERTVVGADAHGAAAVLAEADERDELVADAFELRRVLAVRIFADLEFFLIDEIARVDADFFHPFGGFESGVRFEMDVCDERHVAAGGADFAGDVFEVGGVEFRLGGDADDFAPRVRQGEHLGDAGVGVAGVRGDHRLQADGVSAAHADVADLHLAGEAALVVEEVRAVGQARGRVHFPRYRR